MSKLTVVVWMCLLCAVTALCGLVVGGCATRAPAKQADVQAVGPEGPAEREYRLRSGDELTIRLFHHPELDQTVVVRPDGRISLPLAEEIMAQGVTARELDSELTRAFGSELADPQLTVMLERPADRHVYVGGEVHAPGEQTYRQECTVLQALLKAGGFKRSAAKSQVVLLQRDESGKPIVTVFNARDVLRGKRGASDWALEPCDVLFVPRSTIATMNDFMDQYVRRMLPVDMAVGYSFVDNIDPETTLRIVE